MTTPQAKQLIQSDEDFIYTKRFNFSLAELRVRYPEGCPDRLIATVLMLTEDDVEEAYQKVVAKLRERMGVEGE